MFSQVSSHQSMVHMNYTKYSLPNPILVMWIIISPNEVFGDIIVLASPPRPPVDPDDVNALTRKIFNESLLNYMRVDTCLRYLVSLKSSICNISINNSPISFKYYAQVKNLHTKCVND